MFVKSMFEYPKATAIIIAIFFFSYPAFTQNCASLPGAWQNENGSVLQIDSISDNKQIHGIYKSSTGVDGRIFDLNGWVNNTAGEDPIVIAFSVHWKDYGSITSWTGYCIEVATNAEIHTLWHLVRPHVEHHWEHVITNKSIFIPLSFVSEAGK